LCCCIRRTINCFTEEARIALDTEQQQQQVQVRQQSGRADEQQLRQLQQLSHLPQAATLMLLEAACNMFLPDPELAAIAMFAADLCTKLAAVAQTSEGMNGIVSSSEGTAAAGGAASAAAEDTSYGSELSAGRSERDPSVGGGDVVRPMQQQQQQQPQCTAQSLFVARLLRQVSCNQPSVGFPLTSTDKEGIQITACYCLHVTWGDAQTLCPGVLWLAVVCGASTL
jgi:hypothetical protein